MATHHGGSSSGPPLGVMGRAAHTLCVPQGYAMLCPATPGGAASTIRFAFKSDPLTWVTPRNGQHGYPRAHKVAPCYARQLPGALPQRSVSLLRAIRYPGSLHATANTDTPCPQGCAMLCPATPGGAASTICFAFKGDPLSWVTPRNCQHGYPRAHKVAPCYARHLPGALPQRFVSLLRAIRYPGSLHATANTDTPVPTSRTYSFLYSFPTSA